MTKRFATWHDARAYAQSRANETGLSVGIERMIEFGVIGFNVRFIPAVGLRFGLDLRCEAVEPTVRRKR